MEESIFNFAEPYAVENTQEDKYDFLPAIVSIEVQKFGDVYDTDAGFDLGTIYPALNKPLCVGGKRA